MLEDIAEYRSKQDAQFNEYYRQIFEPQLVIFIYDFNISFGF